jgi:hypothetical protein
MTQQLHGGSEVTAFLVDACDILGAKPKAVVWKIEALEEVSHGLGDKFAAMTPTGVSKLTLTQAGAFWDTSAFGIHETFKTPNTAPRVVTLCLAGETPGAPTWQINGVVSVTYEVLATVGQLTKANVTYQVNGPAAEGLVVGSYGTHTADWDTTATPIDNGAASAAGATLTLQVAALTGGASATVTVRQSTDGTTWTTLDTFPVVATAPTVITRTVAGAIARYLSVAGVLTGTGAITCAVNVVRH